MIKIIFLVLLFNLSLQDTLAPCCYDNLSCVINTNLECTSSNGTYGFANMTCSKNICLNICKPNDDRFTFVPDIELINFRIFHLVNCDGLCIANNCVSVIGFYTFIFFLVVTLLSFLLIIILSLKKKSQRNGYSKLNSDIDF